MLDVLSKKEWLLLGVFATLTPIAIAAMVVRLLSGNPEAVGSTAVAISPPPQAMINDCVMRISDTMQAAPAAVRVDSRSTNFREDRFNVHGNIVRSTGTYDFQCWYMPDGHFQTKQIGHQSIQPILGG